MEGLVPEILVFSGHFADAKRNASIHSFASCFLAGGARVGFVTVGISELSRLKDDGRLHFAMQVGVNRWRRLPNGMDSFIWKAPFHIMNLRSPIANKLATPVYSRFAHWLPEEVHARARRADVIVMEGGFSLPLVRTLRKAAPTAKLLYNAADRISTLNAHPLILETETEVMPIWDLVRVPAQVMLADYAKAKAVAFIPQGLDKGAFDVLSESPYAGPNNVISVGDMLFDPWVIDVLAEKFPAYEFHLFGQGAKPKMQRPNIHAHGEVNFQALAPFIRFADVGLAPYRPGPNVEYLSQSSLKMIQYTYCRLPVVAPMFAAAGRPHVSGYHPGDVQSLCSSFKRAIELDRSGIDTSTVLTWQESFEALLRAAHLDLRGAV